MKKTLLVSSVLALSLLAVPAMAQGYYSGYSRYEAPVTGSQMTDLPSMRANTTRSGSFLSVGSRYDYFDRDTYRDRDYYRDREYYRDRDRDYRDRYYRDRYDRY
ncbi:MAG: hypothetical protein V4559_02245 [Pseudomonadota bacterium]